MNAFNDLKLTNVIVMWLIPYENDGLIFNTEYFVNVWRKEHKMFWIENVRHGIQ